MQACDSTVTGQGAKSSPHSEIFNIYSRLYVHDTQPAIKT